MSPFAPNRHLKSRAPPETSGTFKWAACFCTIIQCKHKHKDVYNLHVLIWCVISISTTWHVQCMSTLITPEWWESNLADIVSCVTGVCLHLHYVVSPKHRLQHHNNKSFSIQRGSMQESVFFIHALFKPSSWCWAKCKVGEKTTVLQKIT